MNPYPKFPFIRKYFTSRKYYINFLELILFLFNDLSFHWIPCCSDIVNCHVQHFNLIAFAPFYSNGWKRFHFNSWIFFLWIPIWSSGTKRYSKFGYTNFTSNFIFLFYSPASFLQFLFFYNIINTWALLSKFIKPSSFSEWRLVPRVNGLSLSSIYFFFFLS